MGVENDINSIFRESLLMMKETRDILKEIQFIVQNLPSRDFIVGKLEMLEERVKSVMGSTKDTEVTKLLHDIHSFITELKKTKAIKKGLSTYDEELL